MIKKIILFLLLYIAINHTAVWAQSTTEIDFSKLFIIIDNIVTQQNNQQMPDIIDYSIEILKKAPNSLSAFYAAGCINATVNAPDEIKPKLKALYDKYFDTIDDLSSDPVEKIILAELLDCGSIINDDYSYESAIESHETGRKALYKMKNFNKNNDYAPIVLLCLKSNTEDSTESIEICNEFLSLYPEHKASPMVFAFMISKKYLYSDAKDYHKYIEEMKKFMEDNKNFKSPCGNYKLYYEFYDSLIHVYLCMNDLNNAQKYLEKLKHDVPDHLDIKQAESEIATYISNNRYYK